MKTYLLYIRIYNIFSNNYTIKIYKVKTDNIYRVIGKIYCTTLEDIKRIDISEYNEEKETFWLKNGYKIKKYYEPKLSEEN